jgi:hypothetical protein
MKKQISILLAVILMLLVITELSSCKNKKDDPIPKNVTVVTGCAKTMYSISYTSDWSMQWKDVRYNQKNKDTIISNSNYGELHIGSSLTSCENNGTKYHFTFWNSDSTVVKDFDWLCPPNDTVYYTLQ